MSWQQSTIDEACLLVTDGTHYTPPDVGQGIPFLTVKDCSNDGHIDLVGCSHINEDEFAKAERGNSAPKRGDVLFSKDGTVGKVYVVDTRETFAVLSSLAILRPDASRLDASYFGWVLKTDSCLDQASQSKTGSAIRRIILKDLKRVRFPLPPLAEQKRIAGILDATDALRAKRREALAQLDSLLQSTFLDMFGDPVTNPKGWEQCVVGDVVHAAKDGPHVSPTYAESGVPFLSTRHIKPGEVVWEDLKYIDQDEANRQWKKCKPEFGDILYTKGGTTGISARVTTSEPFAVWVHVALLKPIVKKVHPIWIEAMLNSAYCYTQSQRYTHGIANRDLGLKRMVKIQMYLPPLAEQRGFAAVVESIDEQKARQRAHLAELDTLFASLQSRAFRGDL